MSKKNKKGYPTSGVNEIWDHLFKLDGMEKMMDGIKDEKTRNDILNFTAGLAAKAQTEIDNVKKNLTQEEATAAYEQMAQEMGKPDDQIKATVEGLKKMQSDARKKVQSIDKGDVSIADLLKNHKKGKF